MTVAELIEKLNEIGGAFGYDKKVYACNDYDGFVADILQVSSDSDLSDGTDVCYIWTK